MSTGVPKAWIVCYDVCDPRRLRRVYDTMRAYGDHVQYSVFRCVLTDKVRAEMEAALIEAVNHAEDQVLLIPLGDPDTAAASFRTIGQPLTHPERVVRVVG